LSWLTLAENREAASSLFDPPPSLQDVEIFTFKIDRDGPTSEFPIALNESPVPTLEMANTRGKRRHHDTSAPGSRRH
jgi:hypothetical protein